MREMKDSGIEWIGEIPKEWELRKIKFLPNNEENSFVDGDWIESPVITDEGIRYYTTGNIGDGFFKEQGNGYISLNTFKMLNCKYAYPSDLVISRLNAPYGRSCILPDNEEKYVLAVDNVILRTNEDKRFICYLTQCLGYQRAVEDISNGTTMKRVSRVKLGNISLPLPRIDLQNKIADYLDTQCSEIDATAEDIQKEISLLEDYKKSVITEAVTKGLNPDAEMKDSGIEWIGEIPKHWKVIRFKYIAIVKSNLVAPIRYMNYPQIAPDVIEKNTGKIISHRSVEEANVDSWNHLFYKGQILYSKIRPVLNKVVIAQYDGLCSADMYPISAKENVRFLQYIMLSAFFVKQVDLVTRDRIKMPKINQDELGNILLVWTSKEEQQQIADFLDSKCSEIDSLIADKKRQLDILADYKKSLIYEYVTGKKEVPVKDF